MKRIVSVPLEGGGVIGIEVEEHSASPIMRGSNAGLNVEKSTGSFEAAIAIVRPVAIAVLQQFTTAVAGTKSVKVKFGLKFSAEAGAIIASASSEANFEIEVRWGHDGGSKEAG